MLLIITVDKSFFLILIAPMFRSVAPAAAAAVSRLGLDDSAILVDNTGSCTLDPANLKTLWVVNSENYIYKPNSLNRAKQV